MFGTSQMTPERRVWRAVAAIMEHDRYMYLSGVLTIGERAVVTAEQAQKDGWPCLTCVTNGRDEYYCEEFIETLTDAELRFVILHEVRHKMYMHHKVMRPYAVENQMLCNMATDYVINAEIVTENAGDRFATAPKGFLHDSKYDGMNSVEVYRELKKQFPQSQQEQKQGQGQQSSGAGELSISASNGESDCHDYAGAQSLTEAEEAELELEIQDALERGIYIAGKAGTGGARDAQKKFLDTGVHWKEFIRDNLTRVTAGKDFSTWRKPNRRFIGSGMYLPSGATRKLDSLCIAIDMSYSIGDREVALFLGGLKEICKNLKPLNIHILYWDTEVVSAEVFKSHTAERAYASTKPCGGGGTDVNCVPAYLKEHKINPCTTIVFTDGEVYGGWGKWNHPVLWAILNDYNRITPPIGKTVQISRKQLRS